MINIEIMRLDRTGIHCANKACKKLPEHMVNILGSVYYIKVDTTVALIKLQDKYEYYCRGCIDETYQYMRSKLDSRLWSFQ